MGLEEDFQRRLKYIKEDSEICQDNKELILQFLDWEAYKLKRKNNLPELDFGCYKTLHGYIKMLNNVNKWFKNKPWIHLTKQDIKEVYDDLEDGKILTNQGRPFKDRKSYYNKVLKSKPFEMAGKDKIAREVIQFYRPTNDGAVRFVHMDTFKKIVSIVIQPKQKALLWVAFDIGENINSLLQLRKRHFTRRIPEDTKEPEYLVQLPQEILKRSRTSRTEPTIHPETVHFLDIVLADLEPDDQVFDFKYGMARKFLGRAVDITKARCMPTDQKVTWKDLRSGMACYLLTVGWHTDEINARLGHKPSSEELDKYVNFLAINRKTPKRKAHESEISRLKATIEEYSQEKKLMASRYEAVQEQLQRIEKALAIKDLYAPSP